MSSVMRHSSVRLGFGKGMVEEQELWVSDSGSPSTEDIRVQPRQADLHASNLADLGIGQSAMGERVRGRTVQKLPPEDVI